MNPATGKRTIAHYRTPPNKIYGKSIEIVLKTLRKDKVHGDNFNKFHTIEKERIRRSYLL